MIRNENSNASMQDAEALAIDALAFMAEDLERLTRFLELTGLAPSSLRAAASEPGFLGSVLDYLMADEALLLAYSANRRLDPAVIVRARGRIAGPAAEP
jgi:hypothetical protein